MPPKPIVEDDVESEDEFALDDEDETEDDITLPDLMQTFFAGENGKNIVDTVCDLQKSIDTQNKMLHKLIKALESSILKNE